MGNRSFLFQRVSAGVLLLNTVLSVMAAPTVAQQVQSTQDGLAQRCAALTARAAAATDRNPEAPDPSTPARDLFCQCLPTAVAGLAVPDAGTTPDNFSQRVQDAAEICSGQSARRWMQQSCEKDPKPPVSLQQVKPYCGCLSTGLDALSDATIAGASRQAYERFQRKLAAREGGQPDPVFEPSEIDTLQFRCQALHR